MVQIKLFVVSASCTPLLVPCRVVLLPIQLPANVPGKIAQVLGPLTPMWEIQLEFLAPVFGLAQTWLLWPTGGVIEDGRCVCVHVSVYVFVSVSQLLHCTKLNFIYSLAFATLLPQYFSMLLPVFMSSCCTT